MKCLITLFPFLTTVLTYQLTKWQIKEPIDLTWYVDEYSVNWPGHNPFVYTRRIAGYNEHGRWYAMNQFCTAEQSGTHLDAPYHFNKNGWKVGDIPVQRLLVHGVVVDVSDMVQRLGPTTELQAKDLVDWERIHGELPGHTVVLIKFGWSSHYRTKEKYLGMNGTDLVFPGIAEDAANWLVGTKKVVGVGVDTASVDSGKSTTFPVHQIFASYSLYNLENLRIPNKLPARGFDLIVMPMKLKEGTGSPVRVVAIPSIRLSVEECTEGFGSVPWYGHTSVVLCALLLLVMYSINCFTL